MEPSQPSGFTTDSQFKHIVENLNQAYYESNRSGVITYCNPAFALIAGTHANNILNTVSFRLVTKEFQKDIIDIYKKALHKKQKDIITEFKTKTYQGDEFWVEQSTHFEFDENNNFIKATHIIRNIDDRKNIEKQLVKSEKLLKEAQHIAQIGSWEYDVNTGIVECSNEVYSLFEVNPENLDNSFHTYLGFVHPDDLENLVKVYLETLVNKTPFEMSHRLLLPDGRIKHVHERSITYYDTDGMPIKSIGTIQDITERKISEDYLHLTLEKYKIVNKHLEASTKIKNLKEFLNYTIDLVFESNFLKTLSQIGFFLTENNNTLRLITNKNISTHQKDTCSFIQFGECLCGKAALSKEVIFTSSQEKHHHPDQVEDCPHSHYIIPIISNDIVLGVLVTSLAENHKADQQEMEFLSAVVDVVAIKIENYLSEENLLQSLDMYQGLFNSVNEAIYIQDNKGTFLNVNLGAEKMYGYSKDEIIGKSPEFLSAPGKNDLKAVFSLLESVYNTGFSQKFEFYGNRKNGDIFPKEVISNKGKYFGNDVIITTARDISERKLYEDALIKSEKDLRALNTTKDKFFSIIAHDLKSPFNSILGFSNLLLAQMKEQDYEGIEKYAAIIQNSSTRAMELLLNLLEWSRSQSGKLEFNPEYIEIISVINETIDLFSEIAEQKSIRILKELPHNAPVLADKSMISTILRNLISNAIKFSMPHNDINIEVKQYPEQIFITVSDKGVGINPTSLTKLFKLDESFTTKGTNNEKGTGLGLILCKEFVEQHQGKIWVDSIPGKGSQFHFTIPQQ